MEAPADIIKLCKELTPVYVETRYPGISEQGFKKITQKETKKDLKNTEDIVRWVKENLY